MVEKRGGSRRTHDGWGCLGSCDSFCGICSGAWLKTRATYLEVLAERVLCQNSARSRDLIANDSNPMVENLGSR